MANPFLFEAFLNTARIGSSISDQLYAFPLKYKPAVDAKLTPEGLQKALNFLEQQTGKQIKTKPVEPGTDPTFAGYFSGEEPGGGLYNAPEDVGKRTIFMAPEAGYHTLFHETGHARDPQLRMENAKQKGFNVKTIQSLPTPAQRLKYLSETLINPSVNAETEAQAYSAFQLPRFAAMNPELGIFTQPIFNDPWFKEYPASYAQKGIDDFYVGETGANSVRYKEIKDSSPVATQIFRPNVALDTLRLALDPDVQAMQQQILNRTTQTVDQRLNPYQTTPTPLQDYWKSKY